PQAVLGVGEEAVAVAVHAAHGDRGVAELGLAFHVPARGVTQRATDAADAEDDLPPQQTCAAALGHGHAQREAAGAARPGHTLRGLDDAVAVGIDVQVGFGRRELVEDDDHAGRPRVAVAELGVALPGTAVADRLLEVVRLLPAQGQHPQGRVLVG